MNDMRAKRGRIESLLNMGFPVTAQEAARWAVCTTNEATILLNQQAEKGQAVEYGQLGKGGERLKLWVAVTHPALRNSIGLFIIAQRHHRDTTMCHNVMIGGNFIECLDCGKHAHLHEGDLLYPLVLHGHNYWKTKRIRPIDF